VPVVPPPLIAVAAAAVQRALAPRERPGAARRIAAGALALVSVGMPFDASRRFRAARTTFEPFDPSQASSLVTDGPYAITRNPMYVGMAGLLAAHALGRGGWLTPLPVAAFVAVIDRVQIRPEEEALRRKFGEEYDSYCARVPRWLGPRG
jgi:protein-S-isoprenylcysteine O-methyltransferase Ste14